MSAKAARRPMPCPRASKANPSRSPMPIVATRTRRATTARRSSRVAKAAAARRGRGQRPRTKATPARAAPRRRASTAGDAQSTGTESRRASKPRIGRAPSLRTSQARRPPVQNARRSRATRPSLSSPTAAASRSAARAAPGERGAEPPAEPRPTTYALPLDSLVAVAESAGLQWVNSDAGKIEAAQSAMAADAPPIHAPREIQASGGQRGRPARAGRDQEGPVAGQAAVRDQRPGNARGCARSLDVRKSAARFDPGRLFSSAQGRRSSERWYAGACMSSSQTIGGVSGSKASRRASLSTSACQWPEASARDEAVEQLVDRAAAVERLVAEQHHVAARAERERGGFGIAHVGAAEPRAPAMLRSSLKIAPSKPSCRRRISRSQRAEKPAGCASTCG